MTEEQIKDLIEENEALRRQVSEKDATIISQGEKIASQRDEITRLL